MLPTLDQIRAHLAGGAPNGASSHSLTGRAYPHAGLVVEDGEGDALYDRRNEGAPPGCVCTQREYICSINEYNGFS